jgi:hypothetical protein
MAYPIQYQQPETLSVPFSVLGDDLKSFKGARSTVRSVASSSGSAGANSNILFNLPTGGTSFIKSNSMYLRGTVVVDQVGITAAPAPANPVVPFTAQWGFAGQGSNADGHYGGASSMISRISVGLGSTTLTWSNYSAFRNSVLTHVTSAEYFTTDLRQCEYAGVMKTNELGADANSRTIHFAIPLWIPCFCSSQNFPALLMNSPISLEIQTESVNKAFFAIQNAVTGYTLSNMSIVYETLDVSQEFKQAMLSSKAGGFYSAHLNNYTAIGANDSALSMRYQIGVGFSSLKSILFTESLSNPTSLQGKSYTSNGLVRYVISQDNFPVSCPNADNDAVAFLEVNRALQKINDSNVTSSIQMINNTNQTGLRTSYTDWNFLAGASTQIISDYNYSSQGTECSSVTIELEHGTPDATKWQNADVHNPTVGGVVQNHSVHTFLLHDSIMSVNVSDGTVQVRN